MWFWASRQALCQFCCMPTVFVFVFVFEMTPYSVDQADLESTAILLPQPSRCSMRDVHHQIHLYLEMLIQILLRSSGSFCQGPWGRPGQGYCQGSGATGMCVGCRAHGTGRPTWSQILGELNPPNHSSFGLTGPGGCLWLREPNQCPILKNKKPHNQFSAIQIKAIICGFPPRDSWGFFLTRLPGN